MNTSRYYSMLLVFCVLVSVCQSAVNITANEVEYRLPNNTKPERYDITIAIYLEKNNFTFSGKVVIDVRILEATQNITLHVHELLIIETVRLKSETMDDVKLKELAYDKKNQILTIPTETQLEMDQNYLLTIEYTGELRSDSPFGFIRASYNDSIGHKKWLAITQLEIDNARHAFPCFDEPAFKSRFTIHIEHGSSYEAFSNMEVFSRKEIVKNGRVITSFVSSFLMSTYSVAFMVSDYAVAYSNSTFYDTYYTVQRVLANKENIDQANHALQECGPILYELQKALNGKYPLDKLDHVAIYSDVFGAFENWGLITYQANELLFDPKIHSDEKMTTIARLMAHEISHQFFGGLVTPKWWSYYWLKEGFATFFSYYIVDLIHPEWNTFHSFITTKLFGSTLPFDATSYSFPMTHYVENAERINSNYYNYRTISYFKAGAVIRMFMHALGEKTFLKGLNHYLYSNSYKVADEDNLFESLEFAVKKDGVLPDSLDIKQMFRSWSNQKGFPLLKVNRNYHSGEIVLRQEKYEEVRNQYPNDFSAWWIYIILYNYASANNPVFNVTTPHGWVSPTDHVIIKNATWSNDGWVIFNLQQTGYYRVLYDERNYHLINEELNNGDLEAIHPLNRAQILNDLDNFVLMDEISPTVLCDTLSYLRRETSYAPLQTAYSIITKWDYYLETSDNSPHFKALVLNLVEPIYEKWTLNEAVGETPLDKMSRNIAVNLACRFGLQKCLDETHMKFKEFLNGSQISPNIREAVISNGLRKASDDEIMKLWEIFINNMDNDLAREIWRSFGDIPNANTVKLILVEAMVKFRLDEARRMKLIIEMIESGPHGALATLRYFLKRLCNLAKIKPAITFDLIAQRISSNDFKEEFFDLIFYARETGAISEESFRDLRRKANKRMEWKENLLLRFESRFFTGKCGKTKFSTEQKLFTIFGLVLGLISLGLCVTYVKCRYRPLNAN